MVNHYRYDDCRANYRNSDRNDVMEELKLWIVIGVITVITWTIIIWEIKTNNNHHNNKKK